jgi:DNA-binding MarR family transcriptional regulator
MKGQLCLEQFLPYRISRLANEISNALARVYSPTFDLSIAEWRMLAAVYHLEPTCVTDLTEYSAMDKVTVSRAIAELVHRKFAEREVDKRDRRRSMISLTADGKELYAKIAAAAVEFENALRADLTNKEMEQFNKVIDQLLDKTAVLQPGSTGLLVHNRLSRST